MTSSTATLALVDDDPGWLRSLARLLVHHGFETRSFTCPHEFLLATRSWSPTCAILDLSMPGLSGLELQDALAKRPLPFPVLFLSGQGDIPSSVRAIKAGALHFLTKPVEETDLLNAVRLALLESERLEGERTELADLRDRFERLTARELEVLRHVLTGKLNKQIAADLGVSEQTVKVHRMNLTQKTGLPSVAELARTAHRLGIAPA